MAVFEQRQDPKMENGPFKLYIKIAWTLGC